MLPLLAFAALSCGTETVVTGRVVGISDGDTLTILDAANQQHRVRLLRIDAPETGQPFGAKSKENLSKLAFGKQARAVVKETDRYGRELAEVNVSGVNLNARQVVDGLAWHYASFAPGDKELPPLQAKARAAKRGLWADARPVPPWDWRKANAGK